MEQAGKKFNDTQQQNKEIYKLDLMDIYNPASIYCRIYTFCINSPQTCIDQIMSHKPTINKFLRKFLRKLYGKCVMNSMQLIYKSVFFKYQKISKGQNHF